MDLQSATDVLTVPFESESAPGPMVVVGPVSLSFLLAGKSIFTVDNGKGTHYTFKVSKVQKAPSDLPVWFVSLLTGPQNTSDYTYLGMVRTESVGSARLTVRLTKASKYADGSTPVAVARWAFKRIQTGQPLPVGYSIHHEGRCGRCGRLLTVPESIVSGFGPECAGKL